MCAVRALTKGEEEQQISSLLSGHPSAVDGGDVDEKTTEPRGYTQVKEGGNFGGKPPSMEAISQTIRGKPPDLIMQQEGTCTTTAGEGNVSDLARQRA